MLTECPTCHQTDGVYVAGDFLAGFGGRRERRAPRLAAYCDNIYCEQTFWWYSKSGRITRRNTERRAKLRSHPVEIGERDAN